MAKLRVTRSTRGQVKLLSLANPALKKLEKRTRINRNKKIQRKRINRRGDLGGPVQDDGSGLPILYPGFRGVYLCALDSWLATKRFGPRVRVMRITGPNHAELNRSAKLEQHILGTGSDTRSKRRVKFIFPNSLPDLTDVAYLIVPVLMTYKKLHFVAYENHCFALVIQLSTGRVYWYDAFGRTRHKRKVGEQLRKYACQMISARLPAGCPELILQPQIWVPTYQKGCLLAVAYIIEKYGCEAFRRAPLRRFDGWEDDMRRIAAEIAESDVAPRRINTRIAEADAESNMRKKVSLQPAFVCQN